MAHGTMPPASGLKSAQHGPELFRGLEHQPGEWATEAAWSAYQVRLAEPLLALKALKSAVVYVWVPTWWHLFHDPAGGFYERLLGDCTPDVAVPRRLLTQCRQLFVYAQAIQHNAASPGGSRFAHASSTSPRAAGIQVIENAPTGCPGAAVLLEELAVMQRRYQVASTGGWRFSTGSDHGPHDDTYDLYGHAFVLLALAHLYKATAMDARVLDLGLTTLQFLHDHMRTKEGFFEQLDPALLPLPRPRRQNPHMHLFEACLAWDHAQFHAVADDLYHLFERRLFDPATGTLIEYLSDDLRSPHPTYGHLLEPGHQAEWAWLLHRYAKLRPALASTLHVRSQQLLSWLSNAGADLYRDRGANLVDRLTGHVLDPRQRIWHLTETLRATAALGHLRHLPIILAQLDAFMRPNGTWVELLDADLRPASTHLPGTTPYHLMALAQADATACM